MITSVELMSMVYKIVRNSTIKTVINGDVYLAGTRPLNSSKNDIVIASLAVPNETLQSSVILVQIFAKDLFLNNNYLPDYTTLKNATKLLTPLFKDLYLNNEKTHIDIEYQRDYKVDGVQEWVSVIRLKTRTINY